MVVQGERSVGVTEEVINGGAFELRVRQGEPTLVPPAEETEKGLYFLSNLDQNIAVIVQTIYCFKAEDQGNERAAEVLRDSFAKVLVHYHPLAGRLTISTEGKLIVDCTGEGAVFVEAEADCDLEDIGDISKPDPATLGKLLYSVPGAKNILEIPLVVAQLVNRFVLVFFNNCEPGAGDQVQMRRVRPWPGDQPLHVRRDCRHGVRQLVGRDGPRPAAIDPTFPRPVPPPLPLASRY
ncbi:hypothetical protein HPP92_024463 [Vanilla planifolia]|uniref:Omega-hydroxypalmitate O-feruloyl transferase n=1 Tax=Vanilla planifolia TaxID=51239 RepID=A0A835UDA6_VANPL|nr:hypothetical protein HPP92_024463 [Vanilla planifolia]